MRTVLSLVLFACPLSASATVTVVKALDTNKPVTEATLAVILECSVVDAHPKLRYAGLEEYEREAARFAKIASANFDHVVHVRNPTS